MRTRPRRRLLFLTLYAVYLVGLCWIAVRAWYWWRLDHSVPGAPSSESVWRLYYPKLHKSGVQSARLNEEDGHFDVLLLGASVLEQAAPLLTSRLAEEIGDGRVRVFNLCTAAHTTRDSVHKFSRLANRHFDLIIIYHGINDVRMSYCRPGEFRADYTHCSHYASFERNLAAGGLSPGELIRHDTTRLIGLGEPLPELLEFGDPLRTAEPFRDNLAAILQAARGRKSPILLMTFAIHLPADYTTERFENGTLDYGPGQYRLGAHVWGRPEDIRIAVEAHNTAITLLAEESADVMLVDQQKLLPAEGEFFSDPCHLTEAGVRRFVENMLPTILERALPNQ